MTLERKYGIATTFQFPLIDRGAVDFENTPVTFQNSDSQISKDAGAFANTGISPTHLGKGIYIQSLSATEMQAAQVTVAYVDITATKLWEDQAVMIDTYGHASAQHAFDLGTAQQNVTVNSVGTAAITADGIATDAIGSAEFSDAAATKVGNATWDTDATGRQTGGTFGQAIGDPGANAETMYEAVVTDAAGTNVAADIIDIKIDTGTTIPGKIDNIGAATGGSANFAASEDNTGGAIIDGVVFAGSVQGATTFGNTEALDGVYHDIDDNGSDVIDIVYGFNIAGSRTATDVVFSGFVQGNGDEMLIKVFDHVGSDWETIGIISGQNGTANITLDRALLGKHTGTGDELGKVYIRLDTDSTTPSNLSVDQLLVSAVNIGQSVGYANGQVWIDTGDGTAGTEAFVNGVADNAVLTQADAQTIATAVNLHDFHIINGSAIVLTASASNQSYFGDHWTLDLNGQACGGLYCQGATVSGAGTSGGEEMHFEGCDIGNTTVEQAHFDKCGFNGTVTMNTTDDYDLHNCYSKGAAVPIFTKTAGQTINMETQNYAGDITVTSLQANDIVELGGFFRSIILNGNSAVVHVHGHYQNLTDNRGSTGGAPVLDITGAIQTADVADILVDTAVIGVLGAGLTDLGGMSTEMIAEVKAEIVAALATDTYAEPAQGTPGATISIEEKISFIYKFLRNRVTSDASGVEVYNDDATTVDHKATQSDDNVIYDRGEFTSGP